MIKRAHNLSRMCRVGCVNITADFALSVVVTFDPREVIKFEEKKWFYCTCYLRCNDNDYDNDIGNNDNDSVRNAPPPPEVQEMG